MPERTRQYSVESDDSLTSIAAKFGVSREAIVKANPQKAIFLIGGSPYFATLRGRYGDPAYEPDILNIPYPREPPAEEASLCWQRSG
jgi:spore germination protein YaaH